MYVLYNSWYLRAKQFAMCVCVYWHEIDHVSVTDREIERKKTKRMEMKAKAKRE